MDAASMTLMRTAALAAALLLMCASVAWAHDSGFGLARYTADGALDSTFGEGGVVVTRSTLRSFVANALALQSDGRILVAGMVSDLTSASLQMAVARYNPDGSPDDGFGTAGIARIPAGDAGAEASSLMLQPDGRILVAGTAFAHGAENDQFALARFTADGKLDESFGNDGIVVTHVGAGAAAAQSLALQPDERIVLAGTAFSNGPTDDDFAVVRYLSDGRLDPGFGAGGMVTTDFGSDGVGARPSLDRAGGVGLEPDGKIVVGGSARGDHQAFVVARYNSDGSLDSTYGLGGKAQATATDPQVFAVVIQPAGGAILAGTAESPRTGAAPFALARFGADGRADQAFGSDGLVTTTFEGSRSGARSAAEQADGKLLVGGAKFGAPSATGDTLAQSGFALARYNADGSIDTRFGTGGRVLTDMGDAGATPVALTVQPDGKIVAAGLVFFRVPTPAGPFDAAMHLAGPAAGLGLLATGLLFALVVRRHRQ